MHCSRLKSVGSYICILKDAVVLYMNIMVPCRIDTSIKTTALLFAPFLGLNTDNLFDDFVIIVSKSSWSLI